MRAHYPLTAAQRDQAIVLQAQMVADLYRQVSLGQSGATASRCVRALREVTALPYEAERTSTLLTGGVPVSREVFYEATV